MASLLPMRLLVLPCKILFNKLSLRKIYARENMPVLASTSFSPCPLSDLKETMVSQSVTKLLRVVEREHVNLAPVFCPSWRLFHHALLAAF